MIYIIEASSSLFLFFYLFFIFYFLFLWVLQMNGSLLYEDL